MTETMREHEDPGTPEAKDEGSFTTVNAERRKSAAGMLEKLSAINKQDEKRQSAVKMHERLAEVDENEDNSESEEEAPLDFNHKLQAAIQVRIKSRFSLRQNMNDKAKAAIEDEALLRQVNQWFEEDYVKTDGKLTQVQAKECMIQWILKVYQLNVAEIFDEIEPTGDELISQEDVINHLRSCSPVWFNAQTQQEETEPPRESNMIFESEFKEKRNEKEDQMAALADFENMKKY